MFTNTALKSGDDRIIDGETYAASHSKEIAEKYYTPKSTGCDKARYTTDYFRQHIGIMVEDDSSDEEEFEDDKRRQLELRQKLEREKTEKYKETDSYKTLAKDRTINDEARLAVIKICIAEAKGMLGGPITNQGRLRDVLLKSKTKSVNKTLVRLMRVLDKAPKELDERLDLQNSTAQIVYCG